MPKQIKANSHVTKEISLNQETAVEIRTLHTSLGLDDGFSETTHFHDPLTPFHLRMLGRDGWFNSEQNCRYRNKEAVMNLNISKS